MVEQTARGNATDGRSPGNRQAGSARRLLLGPESSSSCPRTALGSRAETAAAWSPFRSSLSPAVARLLGRLSVGSAVQRPDDTSNEPYGSLPASPGARPCNHDD